MSTDLEKWRTVDISSTTKSAGVAESPVPSTDPPRSLTTTFAPSLANHSATSLPIPRPAPVTIATFPSTLLVTLSPLEVL